VLRAQFGSGMRDSDARAVTLPPEFSEPAVRACLDYLYTDAADVTEDTALPTLSCAVRLTV
jgi:BTB/POZ domain